MAWTIYRLDTGEMIFNGWPGEEHPSETGFDFDAGTMGAVAAVSEDLVFDEWDPDTRAWAPSVAKIRDRQWQVAKDYSDEVAAGGFDIPTVGRIQTDAASREAIRILVDEARDRIASGDTDWSTAFVNEANEQVPVTAGQILAIYASVRSFLGACYAARQATRDALDAAVAAGATAEEILEIDVTAGYPT